VAAAGAAEAESLAAVVRDSDVVLLSLPDSHAVEEVVAGPGGIMSAVRALYFDYVSGLGVPSLNAAGPLASFGLANSLGYAERISNTVVDALGDVAGGVRLSELAEGSPAKRG
jgi:hypothetical protein